MQKSSFVVSILQKLCFSLEDEIQYNSCLKDGLSIGISYLPIISLCNFKFWEKENPKNSTLENIFQDVNVK